MKRLLAQDYALLLAATKFEYARFRCPEHGAFAIKRSYVTLKPQCPICRQDGVKVDARGKPL